MNNDQPAKPATDNAAAANKISTIQEDNQARPLDKIEGSLNNGETGGATKASGGDEQQEKNR